MAHIIPEWINAEFLQDSLRKDERYKDITVTDFTTSPAAPAGNNYGSVIVRVTINCKLRGDEHKLSVVIKGPITEGPVGQFMKDKGDSEPSFYNVFLPKAYKLVDEHFAPYHFQSSMPTAVLMEDLKESGYLMLDRTTSLDLDHCHLYMKAAASFHATAMALHKQDPDMILSLCTEEMYASDSKSRPFMENLSKWAVECLANHISDKKTSNMLKDSCTYMWDILVEIHKPESKLCSLVQGDPWITNMMFKYDKGVVSDIKLIDFQNLTFGSPIHDLIFFIWLNASDDVKIDHLHEIYMFYFTLLNTNLKKFGCVEIEYDIFMDNIKKFSPFSLLSVAFVPCILGPTPLPMNDLLVMIEKDETVINPLDKYYTKHFCETRLPQIVDCLRREGIFEYLENKVNYIKGKSSEIIIN